MRSGQAVAAMVFGAIIFGAMQMAWPSRWTILGAQPDFLLILLSAFGPFMLRGSGGAFGFALGIIQGAIVGANLTHYVISRTLAGFMLGWFNDLRFVPNGAIVAIVAFIATIFAQVVLMFLAPPPSIGGFLGATIGSAVYNGVLVWPVYALLKRILDPVHR